MAEFKPGDRARDKISGFEGVVTGVHKWINGCTTISVQKETLDKDGLPLKSQSFDAPQCELVEASAPVPEKPSGGPHDQPERVLSPK
ncbi:MAG TPA: hypothetical protein VKS79_21330 [Gemmataceae bacterium]|nr:hypothetical protein [Gemmataceae bacterium]